MAGVKGRSGGPRKNAGGKRPGAGRKPKERPKVKPKVRAAQPEPSAADEAAIGARLPPGPDYAPPPPPPEPAVAPADARLFLEGVLQGTYPADPDKIRAAQALLPFQHKKLGETGKKESQKEEAGKVAGRFAAAVPPRLASIHGKRV